MPSSRGPSSKYPLFVLLIALIGAQLSEADEEALVTVDRRPTSTGHMDPATALVDSLLEFSCKLFEKTRDDKKNVILSPVSIHQALNLLLLGADQDSETQRELLVALGYAKNSTTFEQQAKYHRSHSQFSETFKRVTEASLKRAEAIQERKQSTASDSHSLDFEPPGNPIIDFWSMIVAKNGAKLNPTYLENVQKYYNSSVEQIVDDSGAESRIKKDAIVAKANKWAKEAGFERDLMKPSKLDGDFRALLMTAVRVQAFWFKKFRLIDGTNIFHNFGLKDQLVGAGKLLKATELESTSYIEFRPQSETINFKRLHERLMRKHSESVKQLNGLNFHAINIGLIGGVQLTLLEPLAKGSGLELTNLANELLKLDSDGKSKLYNVLQLIDSPESETRVERLTFPAFKITNHLGLNEPLRGIGIKRAFDKQQAQLSAITEDKLYVGEAKHQAMIEVNEFGLKAAAVTTVELSLLSAVLVQEPIHLQVDSPFMFIVRYERLPLFIGQLVEI